MEKFIIGMKYYNPIEWLVCEIDYTNGSFVRINGSFSKMIASENISIEMKWTKVFSIDNILNFNITSFKCIILLLLSFNNTCISVNGTRFNRNFIDFNAFINISEDIRFA